MACGHGCGNGGEGSYHVICGCGADSAVQAHSMGGLRGGRGTHTGTQTHRGTYKPMLHLPFGNLPFKKVPDKETYML